MLEIAAVAVRAIPYICYYLLAHSSEEYQCAQLKGVYFVSDLSDFLPIFFQLLGIPVQHFGQLVYGAIARDQSDFMPTFFPLLGTRV